MFLLQAAVFPMLRLIRIKIRALLVISHDGPFKTQYIVRASPDSISKFC